MGLNLVVVVVVGSNERKIAPRRRMHDLSSTSSKGAPAVVVELNAHDVRRTLWSEHGMW
jgi:hypothetical protein